MFSLLLSCSPLEKLQSVSIPNDWQLVRIGHTFSFSLPPELAPDDVQVLDSLFGQFSHDACSLYYDFGRFSDPLNSYAERATYQEEAVTIDGHRAKMVTVTASDEDANLPYVAAVHFDRLEDEHRLTMHLRCTTEEARNEYRNIFFSSQFQ